MEPNHYVYRPNIRLVLVIAYEIIWLYKQLLSNDGHNQQEYHQKQDSTHLLVLPNAYYYRMEPNHYFYGPSNNGPN
jgi:hypothetical protein